LASQLSLLPLLQPLLSLIEPYLEPESEQLQPVGDVPPQIKVAIVSTNMVAIHILVDIPLYFRLIIQDR
jgi:hypothetical protein